MTALRKCAFLIFCVLSVTPYAYSQELGNFDDFKPGDKITYSVKTPSSTGEYVFTFTETSPNQVKGVATIAGKKMDFEAPAHGYLSKEFAPGGSFFQKAEWKPAVKMFDKNTKLGDTWQVTTDIDLEEPSIVQEDLYFKAEKIEKIKIAAGEYDAMRVDTTGVIKWKSKKNNDSATATLTMTTWYGVSNQRLVMLKRDYKNTFKGAFTQELMKKPELSNQ